MVPSTVTISVLQNASEDGTHGIVEVSRGSDSTGDLIVGFSVNSMTSTATSDTDYVALGSSVTILDGHTSATFDVVPIDDSDYEGTESVEIDLAGGCSCGCGPSNYTLGSPSTATVTIADDETAPEVTISKVQDAAEGGDNGKFRVSRGTDTVGNLTVQYAFDNITSTATTDDFTSLSGSVTILDGDTFADIDIDAVDDSCHEGPETVKIDLQPDSCGACSFVPAYALGSPSTATLTIVDNDNNDPVGTDDTETIDQYGSVSIPKSTLFTDADDDMLTPTISSGATDGTAFIDGDDNICYFPNSGFIGTDSFTIGVSDGYGGTASATVTVTVQPIISLASTVSFGKAGDTATITVLLSAASSQNINFTYATSNGTAVAGTDYTASTDTLTFTAGQTSKSIPISLLTNLSATDGENFSFTLSSPVNASLAPSRTTESVEIFTLEPGDADATAGLNIIAGQVNTLFGDLNYILNGDDLTSIGINGTLDAMTSIASSLHTDLNDDEDIETDWEDYGEEYEELADEMDALLAKADEIVVAANHAADDSQGEKFRLLGVQTDLNQLSAQLGDVSVELDHQICLLNHLIDTVGDTEDEAMAETVGEFERMQSSIAFGQYFYCSISIDSYAVPDMAPAYIAPLNADYNELNTLKNDALSGQAALNAASAAMYAAPVWDTYDDEWWSMLAAASDTVVATATSPPGESALGYLKDVVMRLNDLATSDTFANTGADTCESNFMGILQNEWNAVGAQYLFAEYYWSDESSNLYNLGVALHDAACRLAGWDS